MAKVNIVVPSAGESVMEADVACWHRADGVFVEADEVVADLETEKATMSVTASESGVLKIRVQAGATVKIGEVIGTIDTEAKEAPKAFKESKVPKVPKVH